MQAAGRLREPRTGHILAPRTTALQLRLHVVEVHAGAMTHVYRPYSIAIGVKSQSMCAMVLGYTRTVSRYSRVLIYCASRYYLLLTLLTYLLTYLLRSTRWLRPSNCLSPRRQSAISGAMATPTRAANVGLYRKLLKAAQNFEPYNIRDYAVRYVRDDYRAAAVLSGQEVRPVCLRRPQPFL